MASELIGWLLETSVASSAAIVLVLLLRRPVRHLLGAHIAYLLWLLVPVAVIAVLVPRSEQASMLGAAMPAIGAGLELATLRNQGLAGIAGPWLLVAAWLAGAAAMLWRLHGQQRRFRAHVGPLRPLRDGLLQANSSAGLPAVIGLWRPRIVLPLDFEARYEPGQRELILQHERIHMRRRDLQVNALAAALRCVYWFNPLVHLAVHRFRHDQELACDELVVTRNPHRRRAYGEAMLKTQLQQLPLPVGCHWQAHHPLKERIEMLGRPVPRKSHRILGGVFVATLASLMAFTAFSAQPPKRTPVTSDVAGNAQPASEPTPVAVLASPDLWPTPAPYYPAEAAALGISGQVMLLVDFAADGSVTGVEIERAEPAGVFDAAAVAAARKWRFQPAMEEGRAVAGRVRVPVDFRADGEEGQ